MEWMGFRASSVPTRPVYYCPICGYVLLKDGSKDNSITGHYSYLDVDGKSASMIDHQTSPRWLKDLTYITIDPDKGCDYNMRNAYESTTTLSDIDIYAGSNVLKVFPTHRLVVVNNRFHQNHFHHHGPVTQTQKGPARQYAMHTACMHLLEKTFINGTNRYVNSFGDLYCALETQCWAETLCFGPRRHIHEEVYIVDAMNWDHKYFGAKGQQMLIGSCPEHALRGGSDFDANPEDCAGFTEYILSKLQPLHSSSSSSIEKEGDLRKLISDLPQELRDNIAEQISWPVEDNLSLEPARCGTPEFWMHALITGNAVPWLWDMNQDMCMVKHHFRKSGESKNDEWDWELLVRQLSQVNVFDFGQAMHDAPKGLRNRRRIWNCCRELVPDMISMERLRKTEDYYKRTATKVSPEACKAADPPSKSASSRQHSETDSSVTESLSTPSHKQQKSSKRGFARALSCVKDKHFGH